MPALALKLLAWCVKNWRAVLLALIVAGILGWWWAHKAADNRMEIRAINAEAALKVERAEREALQRSLANADKAAQQAIAAKAEAEKAAAKRLREIDAEWERIYDAIPDNRSWADTPLPRDVERKLL